MKQIVTTFLLLCCFSVFSQLSISEIQSKFIGTWTQVKKNSIIHETWRAEDGMVVGSSVTLKNGKKGFEENLRIHKKDNDIYYSSLVPENGKWIDFKLEKYTPEEIRFENPTHDFPKYIIYRWVNNDSIVATVSDGKSSLSFNYSRNKNLPCSSIEYSQLDFWIGDWQAFNINGSKAGDSKVSKILDGCILLEEWESSSSQSSFRKYGGKSFNTYDSKKKQWQQTWVDNMGESIEFLEGSFSDSMLTFYSEPFLYAKDTMVMRKLSFTKKSNGDVRQLGEIILNKESIIKTEYDFIYKRKPITNENTFLALLDSMEVRFNRKDFLGVANIYDDDAEIMGGNTFVKGRMNLDNYWYDLGTNYGNTWNLESHWIKIDDKNNTVTQKGKSILTGKDGTQSIVEFILNWKKSISGWKIMQDIYW